MVKEYLVMIHGVQQDLFPKDHRSQYEGFAKQIARLLPGESPWDSPGDLIGIEWGFPEADYPQHPCEADLGHNHLLLSAAQRFYVKPTLRLLDLHRPKHRLLSWLTNKKLRNLMAVGFADMFYYVSKDGKQSLRLSVARQIIDALLDGENEIPSAPISFTFVGHSAGAVIAADFLFFLFDKEREVEDYLGSQICGDEVYRLLIGHLKTLREKVKAGSLRLRRLITFGSPFAMVVLRSAKVVELFANDKPLDPRSYGVIDHDEARVKAFFGGVVAGPRWVNLWDEADLISWPISPLFRSGSGEDDRRNCFLKDQRVNSHWWIGKAHTEYWERRSVHVAIADAWFSETGS